MQSNLTFHFYSLFVFFVKSPEIDSFSKCRLLYIFIAVLVPLRKQEDYYRVTALNILPFLFLNVRH